ncbi:MAG: hypothetical protein NVS3B26_08970 [Mycobacteriales bacterium]
MKRSRCVDIWSSLSYLKRLAANFLTLDRSFVGRVHEDEDDLAIAIAIAIAASVIGLAQATGMTVVAEGVETAAQLAVLRQLRCGCIRGHHRRWTQQGRLPDGARTEVARQGGRLRPRHARPHSRARRLAVEAGVAAACRVIRGARRAATRMDRAAGNGKD